MINYVIASSKSWYKDYPKTEHYNKLNIIEINNRDDLNLEFLERINPKYIFFPHWSWKVGAEIYEKYECVVFHTAPLPYGRGGSPIQNLIVRNIEKSPICALKMTGILDGGPIYDSIEVSLDGTITEIFSQIANCIEKLIIKMCEEDLNPIEQSGDITSFDRLTYADNELKCHYSVKQLYDRIRMVDGLDYPRAYINFGQYVIEFTEAKLDDAQLIANVKVKLKK